MEIYRGEGATHICLNKVALILVIPRLNALQKYHEPFIRLSCSMRYKLHCDQHRSSAFFNSVLILFLNEAQ